MRRPFCLDVYPQYSTDLPARRRAAGYVSTTFHFYHKGLFTFGQGCTVIAALPTYPIRTIKTSRDCCYEGEPHWAASMVLDVEPFQRAARLARATAPLAQARFDIYRVDNALVYIREHCAMDDVRARFFLHVLRPTGGGFTNLDFEFHKHGGFVDGRCVVVRALAQSEVDGIRAIRTGQFVVGEEGNVWAAEFPIAPAGEAGQAMP